ncbi:MAG TPA: hypothetical protein VHN16_04890 [Streptosporangiaceae bacterium]|nr:hypothetical protein [Streptosporangiaceae bacterium]
MRRFEPNVLAAEFCAATADELRVIEITPHDYRRMAELLTPYSSLRHQLARAQVRWLFGSRL